jgi:EAL domain-containing protein (putative c-di-GMP-specific phosphodiesterase class I)
VETDEQLAALRALRCSHSQGFLHSHPVPAAELERILTGQEERRKAGARGR